MMRILLIIFFSLNFTICFSQYKYKVKVKSATLNKLYFSLLTNNKVQEISRDSVSFVNGIADFEGVIKEPSNYMRFEVQKKGKKFMLNSVVDSGENNFTLDLDSQEPKRLEIKNFSSKSNFINQGLEKIVKEEFEAAAKLTGNRNELLLHRDLYAQMLLKQVEYLKLYPNQYFSVLALYHLSNLRNDVDFAYKIIICLEGFDERLRNSILAKQIYSERKELIENKTSSIIGKKVIQFEVKDINNQFFRNSNLKGQNYLIVFSATWCGPCQKQLPRLKEIYERYKAKGLKVVYFNDDDDTVRWKRHVQANNLEWINVSERLRSMASKIPKSFGVYAIPTCILINRDEVITYNSDQMDTELYQLEAFLKKNI